MNIHDSGYKKLFSNKTIFRQLLETFLDEPWVKELDFDKAETIDKSFVSERYQETESDLIYKVQLDGQDVYIYILLEFQSTVDRWMALRVLEYITNFYRDYRGANKGVKKVPPIFPIVLYNGDEKWTAPVNLADLIEENPSLGDYALNFRYYKIAENEFTKEQLLQIRNIVSTLFLAESHYDIDLLIAELGTIFSSEEDRQAVSLFINWFRQLALHERIEFEDFDKLEETYRSAEEVRSMLITAIQKEKQEIREEGRKEGRKEGHEEGISQKTKEIVLNMHAKEYDLETIADITELTVEQVEEIITADEASDDEASDDEPSGSNEECERDASNSSKI